MLSARELNSGALPNRNWINERLTFTHGYGLTLGPVNQVTSEGLPVLFIRDLPPVSTVDPEDHEPSIYFGELSNDYVSRQDARREFHYPKGDDNVYTDYEGTGGVRCRTRSGASCCSRSASDRIKILLSDDITSESRDVRSPHRRARREDRAVPRYDDDPYPAIDDGRLFWIQDAYTTSDRYPYSTPAAGGINYIRNSVKVVIDAYHGTVDVLLRRPAIRSRRRSARVSRPVAAARRDAGRTCASTCAIPRASSRCRRRSTRPTT